MGTIDSIRRELCEFARLLHAKSLVAGLDGNVSARLHTGHFLCTPTASHLGRLTPSDLLLVDLNGMVQGGDTTARPTSEWPMHAACYRARPDVNAVFHAHPIHVVARSLDGAPLDAAVLPEVLVCVGPVASVPYETTGTDRLAHAVGQAIASHDAAILVRHGAVTVGRTVTQACARMEALEHAARILCATTRPPVPLPVDEQQRLDGIRQTLGAV